MSKYSFSQLIREILSKLQGAKTPAYKHTPRMNNAGGWQNFLTAGGATLGHFFVASPRSAFAQLRRRASNWPQGRSLQLRKEDI